MWPRVWVLFTVVAICHAQLQFAPILGNLEIPGVLDQVSSNAANLVANDLIADANQQMLASAMAQQFFGQPGAAVAPISSFASASVSSSPSPSPSFSPSPSVSSSQEPSFASGPLLTPEQAAIIRDMTSAQARRTANLVDRVTTNTVNAVSAAAAARGLASVAGQLSEQTGLTLQFSGSKLQGNALFYWRYIA